MRAKKIQTFSFTFLLILLSFGNAFSQSSDTKVIKLDDANFPVNKIIETETDALNMKKLTGQISGSLFGITSSSAGDVNGDGYPDIIVGASYPPSEAGKAFIYFGGPSYDNLPDIVLSGESAGDGFGSTVAGIGDFNADGYDDVMVAAPGNDAGGTNTGKIYIYYGGAAMNTFPDGIIYGTVNETVGSGMSSAGDFNGDGYSDILYSTPTSSNMTGKVYLLLGGISPDFIPDYTFTGLFANGLFGESVACAGDVNADGFSDIIIGAPNDVVSPTTPGAAYLYYGKAVLSNITRVTLSGLYLNYGDAFGKIVSPAGDVNGDGYSDFMISAPYSTLYATNGGCVHLFLGGASITGEANKIFTSLFNNDKIGLALSDAGDINGDGFSDIIIGAPLSSNAKGKALLVYGSANPGTSITKTYGMTFLNAGDGGLLGASVAKAGDLNNDGYTEFLIGAPGSVSSNPNGSVMIYQNSMTGTDEPDIIFSPVNSTSDYAAIVSSAGDFNGDGYGDVLIGSKNYSNYKGRAEIKLGSAYPENQITLNLQNNINSEQFGTSLANAGDVNGDGFSDVIVGTHYGGKAYIFFGGVSYDGVADLVLSGNSINQFGECVSSAGDINGDGFSDVMVSEMGQYPSDIGYVYIYLGGVNMNNVADYVLTDNMPDYKFGKNIAGGGDFNNDGFSDILVYSQHNANHYGEVRVYFGSSVGPYLKKTYSGEISDENFGKEMKCDGDVNNDGFSDFLIGDNNGNAKLFLGNYVLPNYPQTQISLSDSKPLQFSFGDINSDGYDEMIVTNTYSPVEIYYGGKTVDNIPDLSLVQPGNPEYQGILCFVGDYNKDGFGDVLVANDIVYYGNSRSNALLYLSSGPSVSPIINYIRDVSGDQGGFVNIKWARSGYDASGINRITDYIIERSFAPAGGQFAWQTVGTVPALNNTFYSYTAPTPSDSVNYYFRITARNSSANEYFKSEVISGRSTDNLSPDAPANLAASGITNSINLSWRANTEADLRDYLVYRNGRKISEVTTNSFSDLTASSDSTYIYKIAARDIHYNISAYSDADTASLESITIYNVKIIPEGLYNAQTNQLRMRDTVRAFLWDLTGSEIVDSAVSVIDSVTFLADFNFKYAPSGTYYLAIVHRNCIETWSKTGGEPFTKNGSNSYDFTSNPANAYGSNLKLKAGKYCLFSGDVNRSGVVNATDRTLVRNNGGVTGYTRYDLDGNGVVNAADRTIVRNNSGIAKQRP